MSPSQCTPADDAGQMSSAALSISMVTLEEGMKTLLSKTPEDEATKTYTEIVAEMVKETKLREVNDVMSMLILSQETRAEKGEDEPEWYSPSAMWFAAYPCRQARGEFTKQLFEDHKAWISDDWKSGQFKVLDYACGTGLANQALAPHVAQIIGIDTSKGMVNMYNEIVKRQEHPTCTMQAYVGDLLPHPETGKCPGVAADESARKTIQNFDLAVISLGVDGFEILNQAPDERREQLRESLRAIVDRLGDQGTLLIMDIQKATDQKGPAMYPLIDGRKTTGYHSSDIVEALRSMKVHDIEVLDDKRFRWEATAEEKKIWLPSEADEVFFMLKAKKGEGYKELVEIERQLFLAEILAGIYACPHRGCSYHG
ncbi:MAG: hypothetical protein Q9225_000299 [Loekoesia sp. 1 TL-2023]